MSEHSSKEQIAKIIRDLRDIAKYSNIPVPINIAADCIAALERQASLHNDQCATFEARIVELERENADHEEVHADHRRLVRELDILLNGEAGAAKQASLCDIVAQVAQQKRAAHEPREQFRYGAAARVACQFLLDRFENAPCDSPGSNDCVRCATVSTCRWFLEVLGGKSLETTKTLCSKKGCNETAASWPGFCAEHQPLNTGEHRE